VASDRIPHRYPGSALHSIHQKRIATSVEQQRFIAQQRQMGIGARERGDDGPDSFELARAGRDRLEWSRPQ